MAYKKAKNYCNNLCKITKKAHFEKISKKGFVSSKDFWNTVKPFLNNKGLLINENIVIKEDNEILTDNKVLAKTFNDHYINVVEKTSGITPDILGNPEIKEKDQETIDLIKSKYQNHSSITMINSLNFDKNSFEIPKAKVEEINKFINEINPKKATGPDKIPPKIVKLSANIIDSHLTNIINNDLQKNQFSEDAKKATVKPIFKKKEREIIENYRPVSLLTCFSKIYEKFILEKLEPFVEKFLSKYMAAYRKKYSSNHVLIRLIETWKHNLDTNFIVGTVLMDLSKAFDCIPHDLLVAKLYAYGFGEKTLAFFYSYLKRRKQSVKINDISSTFETILTGVPQGSILGPILFNIFLNDLLFFIEKAELYNFADDNTISAKSQNKEELLNVLKQESEQAVCWFRQNQMIVNPDKFQSMILEKHNKEDESHKLQIFEEKIDTTNSVKLLGLTIDNK